MNYIISVDTEEISSLEYRHKNGRCAKISHDIFMKKALSLAELGLRRTSPNPMVGCVIVKDNVVIGEGWHHEYGKPHAEIEALNDAHEHFHDVRGSTVYVTLEPCSHHGKTGPCADRLVEEGVAEVVVAMTDPNPKVNGKGIKILQDSGIKVTLLNGKLEAAAKWLNRGFVFVHKYHRPFITLKAAMSLDGKMCLDNGSSKWLTGTAARKKAHELRAENDAVLVGVGTVLSDDPELTVRDVAGFNPLRVVLDRKHRTPDNSKIFGSDEKFMFFDDDNLLTVLDKLVEAGVLTLMVEGGPTILSEFLRRNLADYVNFFYAPKILGEGKGIDLGLKRYSVDEAVMLQNVKLTQLDNDVLIEGRLTCSPDL